MQTGTIWQEHMQNLTAPTSNLMILLPKMPPAQSKVQPIFRGAGKVIALDAAARQRANSKRRIACSGTVSPTDLTAA